MNRLAEDLRATEGRCHPCKAVIFANCSSGELVNGVRGKASTLCSKYALGYFRFILGFETGPHDIFLAGLELSM